MFSAFSPFHNNKGKTYFFICNENFKLYLFTRLGIRDFQKKNDEV